MRTFEFEQVRTCCLSKPQVTESFPFDDHTLVWKVAGKLFAIADIDDFTSVSLKCNPQRALELREMYAGINPGWHLNKKHWNSVKAEADVSWPLAEELISHSYDCVIQGMTKKSRLEFGL
ncbi:MAG: MmcQ/YjbR family DNA-binding protein [Bacteroidetes bacterium]|jgi:predicted DNA-binding protein (MmcQ/YjbR family)|nr:MmcQ/YjbR family DNA-binding protein [Bacteroidota bacterium]|tara:strand:- start:811 stop:1170 length:360 start_codon:yes stop_codon:yes gene_type:complete